MKQITISVVCCLFCISCMSMTVTPEQFGAIGDGVCDDAAAINKCLESGQRIKLHKGKSYRISSALTTLKNREFELLGCGARLIIDEHYPLSGISNSIFMFDDKIQEARMFRMSDLEIQCELGQKFADRTQRGDTYFIYIVNCEKVDLDAVTFRSDCEYNNLTFLTSLGSDVRMRNCDLRVNTHSVMGGIFWLMNKNRSKCRIDLRNSYFEHDAADEAMCFSNARSNTIADTQIEVTVDNCTFYSKAECTSPGFIICYNHGAVSNLKLDVSYSRTVFKSDGMHSRKIETYQCGTDTIHNYGSFHTTYNKCEFYYSCSEPSELGLIGLLAKNSNSIPKENISHRFKRCKFRIKNISPLIGDKNGNHKGVYEFCKCQIESDGRVFEKKYNIKTCDVTLKVEDCSVRSKDNKVVSSVFIDKNNHYQVIQ